MHSIHQRLTLRVLVRNSAWTACRIESDGAHQSAARADAPAGPDVVKAASHSMTPSRFAVMLANSRQQVGVLMKYEIAFFALALVLWVEELEEPRHPVRALTPHAARSAKPADAHVRSVVRL